ncbi:MAG: PilZ domain-containing protein [Desulfomonilaceae bacterium]|nr:PilZ domain-containing protein [Desulfomonilaceae bacterium]
MKKKIRLADIIRDMRAGLGDVPIMEKYGIYPHDYEEILQSLKETRAVDERYFQGRMTPQGFRSSQGDSRKVSRCHLVADVRVTDLEAENVSGRLIDITEKGCRLRGIECSVGETRSFRIEADDFEGVVSDCSFTAVCRWGKREQSGGAYVAGFEITHVGMRDRNKLQGIIRLLAICET